MSKMQRVGQYVYPVLILAAGAAMTVVIIGDGTTAEQKPHEVPPMVVEVKTLSIETRQVKVTAMGVVSAARELVVRSEVPGRVVSQHPDLRVGGRLKAGSDLVNIDTRDFNMALSQQKSNVAQAKMELSLEKGRRKVAEHELTLLRRGGEVSGETQDLVLRRPQGRSLNARLRAAKSGLNRARLALERTAVQVPFDALVLAESVETGLVVSASVPLATLVGTDRFHVTVSVPVDRLSLLAVPGVNAADGAGSEALVTYRPGHGTSIRRKGTVLRLLGALEARGHMARVLVAVENPLEVEIGSKDRALPLLLGMRVEVELAGLRLKDVSVLPREALRSGDHAWVVNAKGALERVSVDVAWGLRDEVWVRGLKPEARVVTSPLPMATEGQQVVIQALRETTHE